jgi:hypothetical protein
VIEMNPEHGEALYNLSRQLAQSDPNESKGFQARFEALQTQKQIMDRAQTLGNFALASAAAHDWPQAISQLQEGIQVCGGCTALGQLHKDLGLIYLHSGDKKGGLWELLEAKKLTPADPDMDKAIRMVTSEVRCLVTCATANFAYSALTLCGRDVGAAADSSSAPLTGRSVPMIRMS